jgi:hypothetical protein
LSERGGVYVGGGGGVCAGRQCGGGWRASPDLSASSLPPSHPENGKRPTVINIAIARELTGFLWAAMTDQPLTIHQPQENAA